MLTLLAKFNTEVAWHVLMYRGTEPNTFYVYDVLVYPQKVTGSTVNTNDEDYTQFMVDLTDQQAEDLRGQCHSHVNMGVTPSGVDLTHQEKLLKMLNCQGFYMFQIWNKSLAVNTYIFDYDNNIKYDPEDVDVEVEFEDHTMASEFVKEAKDNVVNAAPPAWSGYGSGSFGYNSGVYKGSLGKDYGSNYDYDKKKDVKSTSAVSGKSEVDQDDLDELDEDEWLAKWVRNNPYYYNDFQGVW
jgi:hypothetical protein